MKLHTVYRPNWHRFIAVLLAISLVLIPVHFPKRVSAEGTDQKIPANYFTDDFSDNRYSNGVTYKWNQNIGSGNTAIVENGVYKIAKGAGSTYSAISRLTVRDSEADHSYEWKDHTVELKYMREPESSTVTQANTLQIFAKIQEDAKCYYRLQLTGNLTVGGTGTFSLFKFYYDEESQTYTSKELGRSGPTTTPGVWYTIRMEFSGNRIKVYYDDKLQINVEDENAYEKGAIELRTQGNSGSGITYIDDFSMTPSGGATVFSDSFVDDRYFNGTTYQWNHGAEIAYQWEKHHTNGTSSSIGLSDQQYADTYGNSLNVDRATSSAADYILLTVKSPDGTDITASWEDYTVEADIRRNTSTSAGVYLMGKVHRDSNGKLYYYALKIHSNHVYLNKYFISSTDNKAYNTASIILASSAAGEGNWAHARMTFEGNRITASLTYIKNGAETTVTNTITDNGTWTSGAAEAGPYFEAGGVGIRVDRAGDTASWVANIDNFKVTSADGTVLFYDDFSDETYFNGKTTRFDPDAIEPWDINWTLNESKLSGTVQSVITEAGTSEICRAAQQAGNSR